MIKDILHIRKFPFVSGFDFAHAPGVYIRHPIERKFYFVHMKSIPTSMIIDHFEGKTTIGLPKHPNTKNVVIDIDDDRDTKYKIDTWEIVKTIVKYLGAPFYIEYSQETNGYHLYYQFKEYVSDNALKFFREYLLEIYKQVVEFKSIGRSMVRLPLSKSYRTAESYENFSKDSECSVERLVEIFSNVRPLPMPNIFHSKNVWGSVAEREGKDNTVRNEKDYSYQAGARIKAQIEIGFSVIRNGGTEHDFIDECVRFDNGSKDMKLPIDKRDAYILQIFDWAKENYEANAKGNSTFDDIDSVAKEQPYFYDKGFEFTNQQSEDIQNVINFYAHTHTNYTDAYIPFFVENLIKLFKHLYIKQLYDQDRPDRYTDDNLLPLNEGFLFPKSLRRKIAKELNIKNIDFAFRFLLKTGLLKILVSKDGYSKSYKGKSRWAHHYVLDLQKINQASICISRIIESTNIPINTIKYYSLSKTYKLYNKQLSELGLDTSFFQEDFPYSRPPPDGLEGIHLRDRLNYLRKLIILP